MLGIPENQGGSEFNHHFIIQVKKERSNSESIFQWCGLNDNVVYFGACRPLFLWYFGFLVQTNFLT